MGKACVTLSLLALFALLGQVEAQAQKISPPLKDVKSDKKFFGPPFPADYSEDARPVVSKSIMNKLRGPGQPYPALQSKDDFDADFVKDENSDKGAWQAQFEYDALRKKLAQEEGGERSAEERAAREAREADDAQRDDDDAANKVKEIEKELAGDSEEDKTADDFGGPPSHEKLEELKKAVADAEAKYEEQKKAFEVCKKQLADAKARVEELKAQQAVMEKKLAEETKLWVEQKSVRLNLKKSKHEAAAKAKAEAIKAASEKVAAAEKTKADLDKALAKEKAEHEKAKKNLQKEKGDLEKVKVDLDKAASRLQALHGYKPAVAPTPTKSSASMMPAFGAMFLALSFLLQ